MNDLLFQYKFLEPKDWGNIEGIIAEIDKNNFFSFGTTA